jgi:hypothetical protein
MDQIAKCKTIVNCARSEFRSSIHLTFLGLLMRLHTFSYAPIYLFLTSSDVFVWQHDIRNIPILNQLNFFFEVYSCGH